MKVSLQEIEVLGEKLFKLRVSEMWEIMGLEQTISWICDKQ